VPFSRLLKFINCKKFAKYSLLLFSLKTSVLYEDKIYHTAHRKNQQIRKASKLEVQHTHIYNTKCTEFYIKIMQSHAFKHYNKLKLILIPRMEKFPTTGQMQK
jgi:hypothetical protein